MTEKSVIVRPAQREDLAQVADLHQSIQDLHLELYPNDFRQTHPSELLAELEAIMTDAHVMIRVASLSDDPKKIVGYSLSRLVQMPGSIILHPVRFLYLDHLGVAPQFRRHGIATCLVKELRADATRMGLSQIRLHVWSKNERARQFFLKEGLSEQNATLVMHLDPGTGS